MISKWVHYTYTLKNIVFLSDYLWIFYETIWKLRMQIREQWDAPYGEMKCSVFIVWVCCRAKRGGLLYGERGRPAAFYK